jgi:hypothetical protein
MKVDLRQLTALAHYSYISAPFPDLSKKIFNFQMPDIFNVSEANLGRPYFMSLTVVDGSTPVTFPNEPLISISRQKTIVETPTVGEDRIGTVKEYINTEDYDIDIKGVCVSDDGKYPAAQVKALNDLFDINKPLDVKDNLFFNLFGIQKIVLRNLRFEEMVGQETIQKYTMNAVSDTPFFAELNDRAKFLQGR